MASSENLPVLYTLSPMRTVALWSFTTLYVLSITLATCKRMELLPISITAIVL